MPIQMPSPRDSYSNSRSPTDDAGLRAYLAKIYSYMAGALVITGVVAMLAANSPAFLNAIYAMQGEAIVGMKPLGWLVTLAPLGLVLWLSFGMQRMSLAAVQASFWTYAVLMGMSLSVLFIIYTGTSIARIFFITAGLFGSMSLYGYSTKKDLTSWGSFLMMGLVGLIIASVVNIFLKSSALQFTLSAIGVLVFVGLTAYDTQKLKQLYYQRSEDRETNGKVAIFGALTLYLDFINIFINLLSLFGNRR
ncbi:MAG: ybhL [Verrucomicrobiaceae bacterium]|nr:ybhL [Verrucomicrobiaceae bacterium]